MPKRKVIYIAGLDRSGSTITGTVLGNHPAIAHYGELQFFAKAVLTNRIINYDQPISESPFWQEIIDAFQQRFGPNVFRDFASVKARFERWRNLPLLLLFFMVQHSDLKAYLSYNTYLVDLLLEKDKKDLICDSSKNMVRRIALWLSGDFQF